MTLLKRPSMSFVLEVALFMEIMNKKWDTDIFEKVIIKL